MAESSSRCAPARFVSLLKNLMKDKRALCSVLSLEIYTLLTRNIEHGLYGDDLGVNT